MSMRRIAATIALVLFAATPTPSPQAQNALQSQPGAVLVFPAVLNDADSRGGTETFVSVTNTSDQAFLVRLSFFEGGTCQPCGLTVPLGSRDSETFAFIRQTAPVPSGAITLIRSLEGSASVSCPAGNGFVTAHLLDDAGRTLYDNVLIGDAVIADYSRHRSASTPALPIQGGSGDGDARLRFDGVAFARLPAELRGDFLTPEPSDGDDGLVFEALLSLFSLNSAPLSGTACELTVFDPEGNATVRSVTFDCWGRINLESLDPGFADPPFGSDHGSLRVRCNTDTTGDGTADTLGGVHGAIIQTPSGGTQLRSADGAREFSGPAAWSRLLAQSSDSGDGVTLDFDTGEDLDTDNDGIADDVDLDPLDPQVCQDADDDGCDDCAVGIDGFGPLPDVSTTNDGPDTDSDGICDLTDNCPTVPNPGQEDADGNGIGNICDVGSTNPVPRRPDGKPTGPVRRHD